MKLFVSAFPCKHCGREEERHRTHRDFRRKGDETPKSGYTSSLVECPGFLKKDNERRASVDVYLGEELRQLHWRPQTGELWALIKNMPVPDFFTKTRPPTEVGVLLRKV